MFKLCENAKVKSGAPSLGDDAPRKEEPKALGGAVQQIKIEDENLDCCVKVCENFKNIFSV